MVLKRGDPMATEYRANGITVVEVTLVHPRRALEPMKLARFILSYWPSVLRIAWHIHRLRADVVHVNTSTNLQGPAAAWLARRPLVWHVREMGPGSVIDRVILRLIRLLAERAVATSHAIAETLEGCGERLRIVFNGIDLSEYENVSADRQVRENLGAQPDQPLVVTIGRIEPLKGQHVFLEAIPAVRTRHPKAFFAFVGGPAVNKPEYEAGLKARCVELGVQDCVCFAGIRKDVPAILAASDVLVLPTVGTEGFGRTVVEAMAAGRPVVATDCGGPREIIEDGETGFLVPTNAPQALADKTSFLLSHPDEARLMGEKGRRRAFALFSLDRVVREMSCLFEEVVLRTSAYVR